MALAPGARLGHFEILEPLGSGGMGEVYRARDLRLDREVAIKVLPTGALADETARKRFRKEARALSKLDHPHIATVHEFGTEAGVDFLVMALISGSTLSETLTAGPLPEKEVLRLGAQLAEGLGAAHERGVVHRDLKPANLRITSEGRLRILDFGLASLREAAPVNTQASTGSLSVSEGVVGTPPYMAPEQLRGQRIDGRTDVYAAGVVLYEMATGRRPFPGTGPLLYDAILNRAPEAPSSVSRSVSAGLEFVILKALEKEPSRRYQSARELLFDLERLLTPSSASGASPGPRARSWRGAWPAAAVLGLALAGLSAWLWHTRSSPAGPIRSLAVLPLKNYSGDARQDFFADGMTDALIADLARIKSLKVISRTSVMQYKDASKPLPQIARELGVEGIVEGSVVRAGDQVRITAQLIDAREDRHVWASNYERKMTDVLALQSEVVRSIAREIQAQVTQPVDERLGSTRSVEPEVYEATLKARLTLENATIVKEIRQAIELFEFATARDPGYAPAWAGLSDASWRLATGGFEVVAPGSVREDAIAMCERALAIDPGLPEAHHARAMISFQGEWDLVGAEQHFLRALSLRPSYATCHIHYGQLLNFLHRPIQAHQHFERARALDPFSRWNDVVVGAWWAYQGNYERALEADRQASQKDPTLWIHRWATGLDHLALGQPREAARAFEEALGLLGGRPAAVLGPMALAYGLGGRRAAARDVLSEMESASQQRYVAPFYLAIAHSGVGEMDEAFALLERALEERSPLLFAALLGFEPLDLALRSDPRWKPFAERARAFVRTPPPPLTG